MSPSWAVKDNSNVFVEHCTHKLCFSEQLPNRGIHWFILDGVIFFSLEAAAPRAQPVTSSMPVQSPEDVAITLVCVTPQPLALSSSPAQSCWPQMHLSSDNGSQWSTAVNFVINEYFFGWYHPLSNSWQLRQMQWTHNVSLQESRKERGKWLNQRLFVFSGHDSLETLLSTIAVCKLLKRIWLSCGLWADGRNYIASLMSWVFDCVRV